VAVINYSSGTLMQMGEKDLGVEVNCLDLGALPQGRSKTLFLAAGCFDNSVRVLSLETSTAAAAGGGVGGGGAAGGGAGVLAQLASIQTPARPESLAFAEMVSDATAAVPGSGSGGGGGAAAASNQPSVALALYLNVGLSSGVLQRVTVDGTSGSLSDTRTRFLGSRSVRLFRTVVQGLPAVLALSSRSWLAYVMQVGLTVAWFGWVG
jgi:splicing factor 3B subunit 3